MNRALARKLNAHRVLLVAPNHSFPRLAEIVMARELIQDVFSHDGDKPRDDYDPNVSKGAMK